MIGRINRREVGANNLPLYLRFARIPIIFANGLLAPLPARVFRIKERAPFALDPCQVELIAVGGEKIGDICNVLFSTRNQLHQDKAFGARQSELSALPFFLRRMFQNVLISRDQRLDPINSHVLVINCYKVMIIPFSNDRHDVNPSQPDRPKVGAIATVEH